MASKRPISVWGVLCIAFGVAVVASGLYRPFDPNYCAEGCGIIGSLIPKLMGLLNSVTGQWVPRAIYIGLGIFLIWKGWEARIPARKGEIDAI